MTLAKKSKKLRLATEIMKMKGKKPTMMAVNSMVGPTNMMNGSQ